MVCFITNERKEADIIQSFNSFSGYNQSISKTNYGFTTYVEFTEEEKAEIVYEQKV